MENQTSIGMNRTGLEMSPLAKDDMIEFARAKADMAPADKGGMQAMHAEYIHEADALGSVPVPGSVGGMAKTAVEKFKGNKPEVLIDKLGERLAFERGGTRLYEALILKCSAVAAPGNGSMGGNGHAVADGAQTKAGNGEAAMTVDLNTLQRIRDQEENHYQLVRRVLRSLGADPTAMTPGADVAGISATGLVAIVTDPATSVAQSLNAVLTAELTDNAGWELLTELAASAGHGDVAKEFAAALSEEQEHLNTIKGWLRSMVISEAT